MLKTRGEALAWWRSGDPTWRGVAWRSGDPTWRWLGGEAEIRRGVGLVVKRWLGGEIAPFILQSARTNDQCGPTLIIAYTQTLGEKTRVAKVYTILRTRHIHVIDLWSAVGA